MEDLRFPIEGDLLRDSSRAMHQVRILYDPSPQSNAEARATTSPFAPMKWGKKAIVAQRDADMGLAPIQYISVGATSQVVTPAAEEFLTSHSNFLQTSRIGAPRKAAESIGLRTHYGIV